MSIESSKVLASSPASTDVYLFHDVFGTPHGVSRIDVDYVTEHQPFEQHADSRQMLLDGRGRDLALELLNETRNMDRVDGGETIDSLPCAPVGKPPGGVQVSAVGVIVVDASDEEL